MNKTPILVIALIALSSVCSAKDLKGGYQQFESAPLQSSKGGWTSQAASIPIQETRPVLEAPIKGSRPLTQEYAAPVQTAHQVPFQASKGGDFYQAAPVQHENFYQASAPLQTESRPLQSIVQSAPVKGYESRPLQMVESKPIQAEYSSKGGLSSSYQAPVQAQASYQAPFQAELPVKGSRQQLPISYQYEARPVQASKGYTQSSYQAPFQAPLKSHSY